MQIRSALVVGGCCSWLVCASVAAAQTPPPRPSPFPTAGSSSPAPPAAPAAPATQTTAAAQTAPPQSDDTLGIVMYPAAVFLEALDAGSGGQQYYLYGTDAPYADIVNYFKNTLKQGGRSLFQAPAMHQFELGRFQEKTMAYPPSVVVKDYTWNGAEGYLHISGTRQQRYRTVIQVVPVIRPVPAAK